MMIADKSQIFEKKIEGPEFGQSGPKSRVCLSSVP